MGSKIKVSIIIPARSERFLLKTVNDVFEKATQPDTECVVILDGGEWPIPPLPERENLIVIRHAEPMGMRTSINEGVLVATGDLICKSDGHCLFDKGFDSVLARDCGPNEVMVPRRKRLDAENWKIEETDRPDIDYTYQSWHPEYFANWRMGFNGKPWDEKNRDESLKAEMLSELFTFQGSFYAMHRSYFESLELLDDINYDSVANEAEEISFKCWLSGGRVIVNKNTFYCHLHKGKRYPRDYERNKRSIDHSAAFTRKWLQDVGLAWKGQTLPFSWLVEKFNPPGWKGWEEVVKGWK
jgi:glycosyltransferase involved in cell wall biosynthesis